MEEPSEDNVQYSVYEDNVLTTRLNIWYEVTMKRYELTNNVEDSVEEADKILEEFDKRFCAEE